MSSSVSDLAYLVDGVVRGDPAVEVSDVTHDSREAGPGTLFVAIRGEHFDGHDFVSEAIAAGSPAVCVETGQEIDVTHLVVDSTRSVLGPISSEVQENPSHGLPVVGITGTNGKTTVTHYISSLAEASGLDAGLIGTVETRLGTTVYPTERTTPEASKLQRLLRTMKDAGADLVSVEVSSHALAMGRVSGTRFAVAAFTNLSQDHLDYHGTMEAYGDAKKRLFAEYEVGTAVVNIDDPVGAEIASRFRGPLLTVGVDGDVRATDLRTSLTVSTFDLTTPGATTPVSAPVAGSFNVENLLMAVGCCLALGMTHNAIVAGIGSISTVPGRFELVSGESPVAVIVDYAHTPQGIAAAIGAARESTPGRVIAVVGAGGDRDRDKRGLMGRAAAKADLAVITSDNPRSEDPRDIIAEVVADLDDSDGVLVEADRRIAISRAIAAAKEGDVVLILGKGHEIGQEVSGEVHPFDDRVVARDALATDSGAADVVPGSGSMTV